MPLGERQSNSFLYITLDVWQDRVFYNEKDYSAGYFAASILNFQKDDLPQLAEHGGTFGNLFPDLITVDDDSKARELLPEVRTKLSELVELLWKYPPFSLNDVDGERHLHQVMLSENSLADLRNPLSRVFDFYPRYCNAMAVAPLAIYHFCIAGWFFELDYLRMCLPATPKMRRNWFLSIACALIASWTSTCLTCSTDSTTDTRPASAEIAGSIFSPPLATHQNTATVSHLRTHG